MFLRLRSKRRFPFPLHSHILHFHRDFIEVCHLGAVQSAPGDLPGRSCASYLLWLVVNVVKMTLSHFFIHFINSSHERNRASAKYVFLVFSTSDVESSIIYSWMASCLAQHSRLDPSRRQKTFENLWKNTFALIQYVPFLLGHPACHAAKQQRQKSREIPEPVIKTKEMRSFRGPF